MFIGGFQGVWDLNGETCPRKLELLKSEGVLFDSRGMIKDTGLVFDEFETENEPGAM
jgi:methylated-DNA-[protein]-cysteine S-methyltransferase